MNIYFIRCGKKGAIKIGVARCVEKRIRSLQCANPYQLHLLAHIKCASTKEALAKEKMLHKMFESQRIRGEWFQGNIKLSRVKEFNACTAIEDQ